MNIADNSAKTIQFKTAKIAAQVRRDIKLITFDSLNLESNLKTKLNIEGFIFQLQVRYNDTWVQIRKNKSFYLAEKIINKLTTR